MIIVYKSYKSSEIATIISFFASFFMIIGALTILGGFGGFLGAYRLSTCLIIIAAGIVILLAGFGLYKFAAYVAQKIHIRKLSNNLKYTKKFVLEHPECHEYCMAHNPIYAHYYNKSLGKANFDPRDYELI